MRTGKIVIAGQAYPITYSLGTQMTLEAEGYKDPSEMLSGGAVVTNFVHLLALMIRAGCDYARRTGADAPAPLGEEEIALLTGPDDIEALMTETAAVIQGERRVSAEDPAPKKRRAAPKT